MGQTTDGKASPRIPDCITSVGTHCHPWVSSTSIKTPRGKRFAATLTNTRGLSPAECAIKHLGSVPETPMNNQTPWGLSPNTLRHGSDHGWQGVPADPRLHHIRGYALPSVGFFYLDQKPPGEEVCCDPNKHPGSVPGWTGTCSDDHGISPCVASTINNAAKPMAPRLTMVANLLRLTQ
ncbi:hypothetical protein Enr13x_01260 [Stieleria neptunia]|uniref:Uncharacterized protein n=1 Tax=Stieleria neptunia TaxID=2527979 RepID=A0A518HHM3_9BACT|nr:hypothetical protein Enr13x_01260 [Stieleria neptunia]